METETVRPIAQGILLTGLIILGLLILTAILSIFVWLVLQ